MGGYRTKFELGLKVVEELDGYHWEMISHFHFRQMKNEWTSNITTTSGGNPKIIMHINRFCRKLLKYEHLHIRREPFTVRSVSL